MEKTENQTTYHQDLEEAIYYLPENYDVSIICKALKAVFGDEGKQKAEQWLIKTRNNIPPKFQEFWEKQVLPSYYQQHISRYLNKHIFDHAKETGWNPKAIRKGKNTKKPPRKTALKQKAQEIDAEKSRKNALQLIKQEGLAPEKQKHLPRMVLNIYGGCYIQKAVQKSEIPDNERDHKAMLTKIVDCEVHVVEAIEVIKPSQQRQKEDKEVRYVLELDDKNGKHTQSIANHEELTTIARFSSFLVKKGFIKFIGSREEFNLFHEFLINKQKYPTLREAYSWGEWREHVFLFENGIYDVTEKQFFEADEQRRIRYNGLYVVCPADREQLRAPRLSLAKEDTQQFLAEKFSLWQSFNGAINVQSTIGYAIACVFSAEIIDDTGSFPILFNYGERGTGKSSSMDWFMALFGYPQGNRQSISKQNTLVAMKRMMTLPHSFPYFLDDFRSHQTNNQAPDLTSSILNWYHRIGTSMGEYSNDRRTSETPMKACVVMTGNDKPIDEAALSRMIILNYNKFLEKEKLSKLPEVKEHTDRFSEFLALILQNYAAIRAEFFQALEANKQFLTTQGFQGRTVENWGIILAGIACIPEVVGALKPWKNEFEGLRSEICAYIQKEEQLQKQQNPIHAFFEVMEHYATQKKEQGSSHYLLDHRHFKLREYERIVDESGKITYEGPTLALNVRGIWNVLEDQRANIIRQTSRVEIESKLQNSSYFIDKSVQVALTKSVSDDKKSSNRRCYLLNVRELTNKMMLEELLEQAREYEKPSARTIAH